MLSFPVPPFDAKSNLEASGAPTVNDDETQGYRAGSIWADTVANKVYICTDPSTGSAQWSDLTVAGTGESNTASNQGVGGVGFYDTKVGVDLQFRNLNSTSDRIGVALDAGNKEVDITLNEGNVVHQNLDGAGSNTHTQIDTHLGSTLNPHAVTNTQVGLGNVTNDAQLKRAAGDIATFSEKTNPVSADLLLIEDSADTNNKKRVQIGNLPHPVFGEDYQLVSSDGASSTTSTTFQDKVVLTTGALTGTYLIVWQSLIWNTDKLGLFRLYNKTDLADISGQRGAKIKDGVNGEKQNFSGIAVITLTGSSKDLAIQFADNVGGETQNISHARIAFWRVS